jgi:hypothetical protein
LRVALHGDRDVLCDLEILAPGLSPTASMERPIASSISL